jgi:carbamoyltransferase
MEDGKVLAVIQEERISRRKNHCGFPELAIREMLRITGVSLAEIDIIAMNGLHTPRPSTKAETLHEYERSDAPLMKVKASLRKGSLYHLYKLLRRKERLACISKIGISSEKVRFIEHHEAHAMAAYYGASWREEPVLVLTCDGSGDELCATVNVSENGKLHRIAAINHEHSLGHIYAKITFSLGMVPNEHEYKLMGMAPYATGEHTKRLFEKFRRLLTLKGLHWERAPFVPHTYYSYRFFRNYIERDRFDHVCGGIQLFTEDLLTRWVAASIDETGIRKVALGGGVFMNVKANKRIAEIDKVEDLFIFPSCGDESNAVGAAWTVYAEESLRQPDLPHISPLRDIYWGSAYNEEEINRALNQINDLHVVRCTDIEARTAKLLSEEQIVARFSGRMEFGARALGNRSILADPRSPKVSRIINDMIKNRDFWMPFAFSVLAERSDDYVVNPKRIDAPYMMLTFDSTNLSACFSAGIHPYDLTARPQFVHRDWNPEYHRLISLFAERTGLHAVLNTSFNLHGYPIVMTPDDAIEVLRKSGLRYLAIGPYLVSKE